MIGSQFTWSCAPVDVVYFILCSPGQGTSLDLCGSYQFHSFCFVDVDIMRWY